MTQRRRLTRPDGTSPGWLIINAADQLTELTVDPDDDNGPAAVTVPHPR